MIRIPDLPANAGLQDVITHLNMSLGLINGYTPFGAPTRFTQYDGLDTSGAVATDYANLISVNEPTAGRALQVLDGLDRIGAQVDNNGLYGERPWETTDSLTVGVDLTVGRDGAFGRDVGVNRNLIVVGSGAIGDDLAVAGKLSVAETSTLTGNVGIGQVPATQKLEVTGTSHFTSRMGIGAAPDATVMLKVTGAAWLTGDVGIKVTPSGDFGLEMADDIGPSTDNARDLGSAAKQWQRLYATNLTIDTTFLKVDKSANQLTVDTNLIIADRSARTVTIGTNGTAPLISASEAVDHVGILTSTPDAPLGVTGMIRALGTALVNPTTGSAVDVFYNTALSIGVIRARDSATGNLLDLQASGLSVRLIGNGVEFFRGDGTGIRFFAAGTGVAKQTVTGVRTGTLAQLQTVVANLLTALSNYSLITDSTT